MPKLKKNLYCDDKTKKNNTQIVAKIQEHKTNAGENLRLTHHRQKATQMQPLRTFVLLWEDQKEQWMDGGEDPWA